MKPEAVTFSLHQICGLAGCPTPAVIACAAIVGDQIGILYACEEHALDSLDEALEVDAGKDPERAH